MEAHEYDTMASFEINYWWYRGLHNVIVDILRQFGVPDGARILDAGCGTGGNLLSLNHHLPASCTYGFDFSPHAARFWSERGLHCCCVASINESMKFLTQATVSLQSCRLTYWKAMLSMKDALSGNFVV
jgi:hypothetical protein